MKLKLLLAILCLIFASHLFAQPRCGFDDIHKRKLQTDPTYKTRFQNETEKISQLVKQSKSARIQPLSPTATYIIPVVVHVVHTGGAIGTTYNPTDTQIEGAIDYLNNVYAGTFTGVQGIGDMRIQFALAQRDPNCNPTNGINRVNGSTLTDYALNGVDPGSGIGTDEINVKNLIRWDPSSYYNIWVVNKIEGNDGTSGSFIAGYAYFPGAPATIDGTVMLATQMRSGAKTLPHEIGHALSLHHPFYGSSGSTCAPAESDCATQGDGVCDTDPVTQPADLTTCRTGTNPCTSTAFSINTENNFMNYTSCFTLFTAGQRTKAWAAMSLPSRVSLINSLGGTPPNSGATTCTPKINFEFTDDQKTEATASIDGTCRSYTDYTYNMVIGNSPSATATATLLLSGTATEKVDYDVTTNGNFTTPSKNLTYSSGSVTSQPFTIRVYNDAIVDGTETLTIGFTLNNGGGNAVIGDGRPTFTFTINDNDNAPVAGGATGTGSVGSSLGTLPESPFDAREAKQRTQFLYRASELQAAGIPAGTISGIALNIQKLSTRPFNNFTIKIGTTSLNNLIESPSVYLVSGNVVKSVSSYNTIAGWNNFTFDVPLIWNGTSNLVVEICFDNGTTDAANAVDRVLLYSDGGSSSQGNFFWQKGINCIESFSSVGGYTSGYKPIIRFNYGIPETPIQSTVNTSKLEYLGPNADVYFYDQTENKLLARIKNLTSHDYGCTTIEIDRAGTGSQAFTTNTVSQHLLNKTFHVSPANNNPAGQYEITLYYSDAEKTGWENGTGQSWNNILLVKVPSQISHYTPSTPAPDGAGVVVTATPIRGTLGTQHSLTATFNNGFSGFGAGIPVTTLPVTLLNFEGKLEQKQVLLNWATSFEQNTRNFEIEKSSDGAHFTKIGSVNAVGNSTTKQSYSFRDHKLATSNFYRLRINDQDGATVLSKVLSFKFDEISQNIWLEKTIIKDQIDVRLSKKVKMMKLQLINTNSHMILEKVLANPSTSLKWTLPGYLASGVYIVRVTVDGQVFTFKVIKE